MDHHGFGHLYPRPTLLSLSLSLSLCCLAVPQDRENRAANACVFVGQRQEGSIYLPMLERGTLCLPGCCDPMAYWLVGSTACACPYDIIIAVEGLLIMVLAVPSRPPSLDLWYLPPAVPGGGSRGGCFRGSG